jgi:Tfp pilus assembly protein PilN
MLIELTQEQLSALEMLSIIGDYYLDDREQSKPQYEDDRETVTQAQDVIQQIQQQFMGINNA